MGESLLQSRNLTLFFSPFAMSLRGKIAVITGAASGLGRGFAVAFVKEGTSLKEQMALRSFPDIWIRSFRPCCLPCPKCHSVFN